MGDAFFFSATFKDHGPLGLTFNVKAKTTVVTEVMPNSAAHRAQIAVGDQIVGISWKDDALELHEAWRCLLSSHGVHP